MANTHFASATPHAKCNDGDDCPHHHHHHHHHRHHRHPVSTQRHYLPLVFHIALFVSTMPQFRIYGSVFVDCMHNDRLLQTARLWEPSSCMYQRVVILMGVLVVSEHVLCSRTVCQWKKPHSITLAGSKLVRSWSSTSFEAVCDQLRTSLEPASVMEFGLNRRRCVTYTVSQKVPTFKLSATLSNLNRFSKCLHYWKAYKICYRINTKLLTSR